VPNRTRETVSFRVSHETAERLRNAAYWTRRTAGAIAEDALVTFIEKLEKDENEGQPFAQRKDELRATGRPRTS
jgi:predicted transcriptional regulator